MYATHIGAIKVIVSRRLANEERVTIISDDGHSIDLTLVAAEIIIEDERDNAAPIPEPADENKLRPGQWSNNG